MDSTKFRNGFVYLLILVAIVAILLSYRSQTPQNEVLAISQLAADVIDDALHVIDVAADGSGMDFRSPRPLDD